MADKKVFDYSRYIFILVFLFILYLTFLVIRPFIYALIMAAVLAYVFYPIYKRLLGPLRAPWAASLATVILMVIVILLPIIFFLFSLSGEAEGVYTFVSQSFSSGNITQVACGRSEFLCDVLHTTRLESVLEAFVRNGINFILGLSENIVSSITQLVIQIVVLFVLTFMFLMKGPVIIRSLWLMVPLAKHHRAKITESINSMVRGIMFGHIITAIIQGTVAAIGYFIFGVPSPLFWGFLTLLASFVPIVGTTVVWVPLAAYFILSPGQPVWNGIGLALYGTFCISLIDNIIKPKVIADHTNIHPAVIFLGLVGGISAFGLIGTILGPLILSLFILFIKFYEDEKHDV